MSRGERIGLWVAIGVLFVWLLVLTVMTAGEFAAVNRLLRGEAAVGPQTEAWSQPGPIAPPSPTPWWGGEDGAAGEGGEAGEAGIAPDSQTWNPPSGPPEGVRVGIAGVEVLSDTLAMTVTVRSSGAGDLLYEPPVVVDEAGRVYPVTGESLETARYAFLDLVTRGEATARLVFAGSPAPEARLILVFNPNQEPTDLLAPRVEVGVPVPAMPTEEPEEG